MLKNTLMVSTVVLGGLLFSGCSTLATKYTKIEQPYKSEPIVKLTIDVDSTSLGGLNVGNVERKNYLYAFGAAAQTTLDSGYKYFTIIKPEPLIKQYTDRKVKNLEDAYAACDSGDGSFAVFTSTIVSDLKPNNCDSITIAWSREATLTGGTVSHAPILLTIKMSNERLSKYASFDAHEVLNSKLLEGLDRDYFKNHKR